MNNVKKTNSLIMNNVYVTNQFNSNHKKKDMKKTLKKKILFFMEYIERITKNLFEMLSDREYSFNKNTHFIREDDFSTIKGETNKKKKFMVILIEKIGVHFLRKITEDLDIQNIHFIFIYTRDITTFSKKKIRSLLPSFELFHYVFFLMNPTKHKFVPKHALLDERSKEKMLSKYNPEEFPKILKSDPICKYYNFKKNDIVKIERPLPNGITMDVYRIVTSSI